VAKNIVKWSNLRAQIENQPITLMINFTSGLLLDPVLTGPTGTVWTWPDGSTTSTGNTPSPTLTAAGRYKVTMDDQAELTGIDVSDDAVKCIELTFLMTGLATLTAPNNPSLDVDGLVDQIYALRETLPAMTVNIGGTCPDVSGSRISKILELTSSYGHTWTYNSSAFLFTVKTDNTGTSNNDQFTIPLFSGETYSFTVYYDGTETTHSSDSDLTLTFPSGAGTYGVAITGTFPRIRFNNTGDKLKMTGITQFGDVSWGTNWNGAFYGCSNIIGACPVLPNVIQDLSNALRDCKFTGSMPSLPTSLTTAITAFRGCSSFTGGIPAAPATLTNAFGMYFQLSNLTGTIADQSAADGTLTNVGSMFNGCTNLTGNSEDFWNWTTPPTTTTDCYNGSTSLTNYATIPSAYGGLGEPTASTAAYSVARRIYSSYSGSLIRVRRASDSTEQDIGVDGSGDLDTAALATFCSGTDGFIKTVYDQVASNDLTQTNTAKQPKIYDSATGVNTDNGQPAALFDGSNDQLTFTTSPAYATFDHYQVYSSTDRQVILLQYGASAYCEVAQDTSSLTALYANYGTPSFRVDGAAQSWTTRDDVHTALCTGSQILETTNGANTSTWSTMTIGDGSFSSFEFAGNWTEMIVYNSDQTSNNTLNELAINAYYGIY